MLTSPEIDLLAAALAKAQAIMGGALKDSTNPFFKSKYADLESVWQACRKTLTDNGLSVVQGSGFRAECGTFITTRLLHSSGQWIEGELPVVAKEPTPQGMGSAITYARRYALAAMVGVYQTDDDAEAAHGRQAGHTTNPRSEPEYKVDPEIRDQYATAVKMAVATKNVRGLYDMHLELKDDHTMYIAVSDCLNTAEKNALKDAVAALRKVG